MADVLATLTSATWSDASIRGFAWPVDRFVLRLTADPAVDKVLVANPYRSAPVVAAKRLLGATSRPRTANGRPLLQPYRLRRDDPASVDRVARAYRAYSDRLRRAAGEHGLQRPAVMTAHPLVAGFGSFDWAGPVTYYAEDDWAAHETFRRVWPAIEVAYERLRDRGDGVAAVSRELIGRIAPSGPSALVPNAVEPAEWTASQIEVPAWLEGRNRPRLVYVGGLGERLDAPLLRALAQSLPDASLNLVGPVMDPAALEPLRSLPNVFVGPQVDRESLAAILRSCDVGLLPHVHTDLTRSMSPLKVYEYLAAGLPVVSVDLPPLRGIHPRVSLADDHASFLGAVRDAVAAGPLSDGDRRAFIDANSWDARYRSVIALVLRASGSELG